MRGSQHRATVLSDWLQSGSENVSSVATTNIGPAVSWAADLQFLVSGCFAALNKKIERASELVRQDFVK